MDLSIGGGVKSSHSKGFSDLGSLAAKQLSSLEGSAFPSTVGRGQKINLSKAKVRFSGEGSDLSDGVKSLVSTIEKTVGLPRSQGYLLPRNDMGKKAAFTLAEGATPIKCHAELVSASNQCHSLGSAYSESRNDVKMARSRNKFGMTSKKVAFTLAEVLITLGIIGIVAALTFPALMQTYKKKEVETRLKRFYSMINQAIKLSEVENGEALYWKKEDSIYNDGNFDYEANGNSVKTFFLKYIGPYMKYQKIVDAENAADDDGNPSGTYMSVYLVDGSKFEMHNGDCIDFIYDVNDDKGPNEYGRDRFNFAMCFSDLQRSNMFGNKDIIFGSMYYPSMYKTRAERLQVCKSSGWWCTSLIMYFDNWEIKDDYPQKF